MRPLILAVVLLAALPLSAQLSESVTVEVVEVPVYVHRGFHPVEGLTRENFELFVEGQPQPIDYFDVVDMGAAPALHTESGAMNVPDLRQRRLFLLLFDMFYTRPGVLHRSRRAAVEFVEQGAPGDVFAVAVLSKAGRFEFVTPFTTDRQSVLAAIGGVQGRSAEHPMRTMITQGTSGAAWSALVETIGPEGGAGGRSGRGGDRSGEIESAETGGGAAMDDARARPLQKLQEDLLLDFADAARRMGQLQGHKHVVLLAEGFTLNYKSSYGMELLYDMFEAFQQANTFLHTIDIAGLRHTFDPMEGASLHTLAVGTGGMPQRNSNDFRQLLTQVRERNRYVYVLGFRPRAPKQGHNDVRVKLRNVEPDAALSYRRGFSTSRAPGAPTDGLRLADIILNDVPQSGVSAAIETTRTGLRIVIPAAASAALGGRGEVDLMVYVFDANDAIVEGRQLRLPVHGQARTIDARLPLGKGRYTAKVLLRAGESVGLATKEFEVR